jgi:hypothetical protein
MINLLNQHLSIFLFKFFITVKILINYKTDQYHRLFIVKCSKTNSVKMQTVIHTCIHMHKNFDMQSIPFQMVHYEPIKIIPW